MESIRDIYRIGHGPSSSHTMGPRAAAEAFGKEYADAASFQATLFGSLAATGRGHLTDVAIEAAFAPRAVSFEWRPDLQKPRHTNALELRAMTSDGSVLGGLTVYSVGGGKIVREASYRFRYHRRDDEPNRQRPSQDIQGNGGRRACLPGCLRLVLFAASAFSCGRHHDPSR